MSGLEVDFSGVGASEKRLEAGETYVGTITKLNKHFNEDKGSMSVSFMIEINDKPYYGKRYLVGGKDKNYYLKKALDVFGVEVPKGKVDLDSLFESSIKGIKAEFTVNSREFNGKTYTDLEPTQYLGRLTEAELALMEVPF